MATDYRGIWRYQNFSADKRFCRFYLVTPDLHRVCRGITSTTRTATVESERARSRDKLEMRAPLLRRGARLSSKRVITGPER